MPTKKQRACPHPPAHVHPTYDDRYEICDLCHVIRPHPLPAPWIVEWDESQPAEQPPALFQDVVPTPPARRQQTTRVHVPTKRPRVTLREPEPAEQQQPQTDGNPRTFRDLLHAARRDRAIMGAVNQSWRTRPQPTLDELYSPDQIAPCHRCKGTGSIHDNPYKDTPDIFDPVRYEAHPDDVPARTCPRCEGAGRIPRYTTPPRAC